MRTSIDIDDDLLAAAMEATGAATAQAAVEAALLEVVQNHQRRRALAELRGIGWDGDLEMLRDGGPRTEGAFSDEDGAA